MSTKIIVERISCVVPDMSSESYERAAEILGYDSFEDRQHIYFYRPSDRGRSIEARAIVEPTNEPCTMTAVEWKSHRKSLKLTQKTLAEKLGVNVITIKRRESGETVIDAEAALAIRTIK